MEESSVLKLSLWSYYMNTNEIPDELSHENVNHIFVVVNFLSEVIFSFPLFLSIVMYANEVETKEK